MIIFNFQKTRKLKEVIIFMQDTQHFKTHSIVLLSAPLACYYIYSIIFFNFVNIFMFYILTQLEFDNI